VEILGLDKFKRKSGKIVVSNDDILKTAEWDSKRAKEQAVDRTAVLDCYRTNAPPVIDGRTNDWEAESTSARLGEFMGERIHGATLRSAWDDQNLYLCYEVVGLGPMKNTGEQWDRLFKTGAAVDLQIGLDQTADSNRAIPVAGDKRLLMTFAGPGEKPAPFSMRPWSPGRPPMPSGTRFLPSPTSSSTAFASSTTSSSPLRECRSIRRRGIDPAGGTWPLNRPKIFASSWTGESSPPTRQAMPSLSACTGRTRPRASSPTSPAKRGCTRIYGATSCFTTGPPRRGIDAGRPESPVRNRQQDR